MIFMKHRNLEKAVVLSLILSTGVYGSAWAEDIQSGGLWTDAYKEVEAGDNLVITADGIGAGYEGTINVIDGNLTITSGNNALESGYKEKAQLKVLANDIYINSGENGILASWGSSAEEAGTDAPQKLSGNIEIGSVDRNINSLTIVANGQGIDNKKGNVTIYGNKDSVIDITSGNGGMSSDQAAINNNADNGNIIINAGSIRLNALGGSGIINDGKVYEYKKFFILWLPQEIEDVKSTTTLNSSEVNITAIEDGIYNNLGETNLNTSGSNTIIADKNAVYANGSGTININATKDSNTNNGISTLKDYYDYNNNLYGDLNGIKSISTGTTNIIADNNNNISGKENGIYTTGKGLINVEAEAINNINSDIVNEDGYGIIYAINAEKGTVNLKAGLLNTIYGAVYASSKDANVNVKNLNEGFDSENYVYSATVIEGAGDLDTSEGSKFEGKQVTSALYAEKGANINLTGDNTVATWADYNDNDTLERTIWAYSDDKKVGSTINLTGAAHIRTNNYELSPKSADVAVAAGTATGLTAEIVNDFGKDADDKRSDKRSVVNINYADSATGGRSYIQGDILAAYAGEVNINPLAENSRAANNAGITITGNLLAGNNGILSVDLGQGGVLTGRADDYGDAGYVENGRVGVDSEGNLKTFYNPAFSSDIYKGGDITLTMGDGSQWNVQGQSWITNLNTNGEVTIDLTNIAEEYKNYDSHALTIRNLNGNADIIMDLDGNRSQSDMLYIGQGNGEYNVELENLVTVDDMFADSGKGYKFSGLRFATVGMGSDVKFNVTAKDQGFNNVTYIVDTDVYNSNESAHENDAYNGESISNEKPGNSLVESMLDEAEKSKANEIMLLAADDEPVNDNETQHLNYKLVAMESSGITDAGKTMLNMSRANYSNAIYMDRLNKRLGEARYINDDPEEDEGMWVRVRHDRIGKDEAFRSQNTMYELGYDKRQECDNGKRRVGFAVDYMHGDTGYNDIAGKGEIDRYGLWLYDTWTGNKGHYVDYVAKWGHLSNDFEVYNSEGKVTGDYSNNVFSISAEYGRKKDMGNDWYFEPQAQLQLARVTGADYTTSQGTKVSVDGINSLIGRAGFRIGKDFGEEKQSTLYFKADVLHEFLGDQTIRALDGTTNGWQSVDYENQGTWYDIGIGYAAMLSQSTYAFIDLEQSFGNDNDDTYQINAGVRWTF